jgi:hypothetical protein
MRPDERRIDVRKPLEHLAYLSLPMNNGGVVLDVSVGGLGFQAIAPVETDGPIHFRFAIGSGPTIKAVGELAWKDETGKIGGLRFTELPEEIREQIRLWADPSKMQVQTRANSEAKTRVLDIPAVDPAIVTIVDARGEAVLAPAVNIPAAAPVIESAALARGIGADLAPVVVPVVATRPADFHHPLLYSLKPAIYSAPFYELSMFPLSLIREQPRAAAVAASHSVAIRQHPVAAVGLIIALAFVVSTGILAYVSTSREGELLFDWGAKMWGGFSSQLIPRDSASPENSAPDSSITIPR